MHIKELVVILKDIFIIGSEFVRFVLAELADLNSLMLSLLTLGLRLAQRIQETLHQNVHQLAAVMQGINTLFFPLLKDLELLLVHIICKHLVVFLIILHVEIVLVLAIRSELGLALWDEVLDALALGHGVLLSLEPHHLLDHLEAADFWLLDLNGVAIFVEGRIRVGHAHQAFPVATVDVLAVHLLPHLVANHFF